MESNDDIFVVNYSKVIEDKNLLAVTKLLAKDLMHTGYSSVGKFIQSLSDSDLHSLLQTGEEECENQYEDLIVISEMLAAGEGCDIEMTKDIACDRLSALIMFLTIETLHRKGLVKAYHENMSFHPDSGDNIVVEKL